MNTLKNLQGVKVLIADDQEENLFVLSEALSMHGAEVIQAENGAGAEKQLDNFHPDLIISDISMPIVDGIEFARRVKSHPIRRFIPFLLLTAQTLPEEVSEGFAAGADDYIKKPFNREELIARVCAALRTKKIYSELKEVYRLNQELSQKITSQTHFSEIVGSSDAIKEVFTLISKIADSDVPVLITGESGSGKELAARAIHVHSTRSNKPFVVQNCAAFNDQLLESELFGHIKGSFSGAAKDKLGLFEVADGGTFFLDEIGEMSPTMQAKLLRVLQDGTFTPVGSTQLKTVKVRIVAATHRDLPALIKEGKFREDLWYRLNVVCLELPSLRQRRSDIPLLVESFLKQIAERQRKECKQISNSALAALVAYDWPGNIRQLRNEIERAVLIAADSDLILDQHLSSQLTSATTTSSTQPLAATSGKSLKLLLADLERRVISEALKRHVNNKSEVARELDMSRTNLIAKVKEYNLE
jgi:two-component system response regulator HupR/HoxA